MNKTMSNIAMESFHKYKLHWDVISFMGWHHSGFSPTDDNPLAGSRNQAREFEHYPY